MPLKRGPELDAIIETALGIADKRGQRPTTAHLLLALMSQKSTAGELLRRLEIEERRVNSAIKAVGAEPAGLIDRVAERAQLLARRAPSVSAGEEGRSSGLHLLAAVTKVPESAARRCLEEVGCDPAAVGTAALGCLSGAGHKALSGAARNGGEAVRVAKSEASTRRVKSAAKAAGAPRSRGGRSRRRSDKVSGAAKGPAKQRKAKPTPKASPRSPARARARVQVPDLGDPWASKGANPPARRPRRAASTEPSLSETIASLPLLGRIGRDLSVAAREGKLDPLVGRSREIERIVDALNRRRGNVPCIVGEPGVGKTALVEGLARRLERGEVRGLEGRVLVQVTVGDLLAGTGVRGALAERLASLRSDVAGLEGRVVVFLDEIHTLLAAAGGEAGEGAPELRGAMASADFPCILATTGEAYRRHVEQDPGLERRITRIDVDEPSLEEAVEIVRGASRRYADHHETEFDEEAIDASVRLTHRYMTERRLPDKALAVLDLAGARARRHSEGTVSSGDVAAVIADLTGVPAERLAATDAERLLALEERLAERIVGHGANIARIAEALRRNAAGLGGRRPVGSFLLLGSTGVGKTETARALSNYLFPGGGGMSRFDMSELSEPHSVARLVGAPPGYVGHEAGGHLTEAVRARPYQVVLLDEVEKAHPRVLMLLLQVLEDGRLTDGRGRLVDFTSTVVIMTSNLGVGEASRGVIGFGSARTDGAGEATLGAARRALPPELWNRFDEVLYFSELTRPQVEEVARRMLERTAAQLAEQREVDVAFDDSVVAHLIDNGGYEPALGARPMRRAVQRLVESRLAEAVLRSASHPTEGRLLVRVEEGVVVVDSLQAPIPPRQGTGEPLLAP